jgi:hypothetical protein
MEWRKIGGISERGGYGDILGYTPREAIIAVYRGVEDGRYFDHLDFYWNNALKWDGTKEQYEKVLRGELK